MAEHWIDASKALEIAGSNFALCARLRAGLIRSRARLLLIGEDRREEVKVPAQFWWADGREALEQDWNSGDFSTWIDQSQHWQAFGVKLDLAGVAEMLPFERRAIMARELSVAANTDWMAAKAARAFMYNELGVQPVVAGVALLDQCRLGFVTARAVVMQQADHAQHVTNWTDEAREWDIPGWFWQGFTNHGSSSQDWERGVFAGKGRGPSGVCYMTLTGVYFARAPLEAMRPAPFGGIAVATLPTLSKAGRPPADFWDDLWCAVWGQIYRAELLPKRQADVERAMLTWASDQEFDLSPSAAKPRARKLFLEYEKEGKNS